MAALTAALTAVAACLAVAGPVSAAAGDSGDRVPEVEDLGPTTYAERGPFAVGQATLTLPSNDAPVEVWYPARKRDVAGKPAARYDVIDWLPSYLQSLIPAGATVSHPSGGVRGVPVARGRFPLVVFSHGYAGFRHQSSFLTAWLASWGFVVAAPDHQSRSLTAVLSGTATQGNADVKDLRATLNLMRTKGAARSGRFHGHLDTSRVGAIGHSAGGAAVVRWAATDRRVSTYVALAGAMRDGKVPRQPGLLMAGTSDGIIDSERIVAAYDKLRKPKRLVLVGGGHHAFSDLCEVGASDGGLLAVAELLKFPVSDSLKTLASDGCEPPALAPTKAWPAIRQVTVAHLRRTFGFDRSGAAWRGLKAAFPGVVAGTRSAR